MEPSSEKLYYSIREVSETADVKPHVLRYWESQFNILRPRKNRAGNRMYRRRDLNLVLTIRDLLYRNGYTIAGARRRLQEARRANSLRDGMLVGLDVEVGAPPAAEPLPDSPAPESPPLADEERSAPSDQLTLADGARSRVLRELREEVEDLLQLLMSPPAGSGVGENRG